MAGTDPLTGARLGDDNDAPTGGTFLARVVTDLRTMVNPRFPTVAARDTAYNTFIVGGGALKNGMTCWTDDAGQWDRIAGAWKLRVAVDPNTATRSYADGTQGDLSLIGGWTVFPGYHTPAWYRSSSGLVTLSGMVLRTAGSFALGTGASGFQFATLDPSIVSVSTVSPLCYTAFTSAASTYPARLYAAANSNILQITGMDSGSGTIQQNVSFINLDGVGWHV